MTYPRSELSFKSSGSRYRMLSYSQGLRMFGGLFFFFSAIAFFSQQQHEMENKNEEEFSNGLENPFSKQNWQFLDFKATASISYSYCNLYSKDSSKLDENQFDHLNRH